MRPAPPPYWAPERFAPEHVVSTDIAALNLLPDNAAAYADRIELAIDHHGSHGFFAEQVCLDADAAACGEILYGIIRELTAVTPDIAHAAVRGHRTGHPAALYTATPLPRPTALHRSCWAAASTWGR